MFEQHDPLRSAGTECSSIILFPSLWQPSGAEVSMKLIGRWFAQRHANNSRETVVENHEKQRSRKYVQRFESEW